MLFHHLVTFKLHPDHLDSGSTCQGGCDKKRKQQHRGLTFMVCCSTLSWSSWDWSSSACRTDCSFCRCASNSWDWAWMRFRSRQQICSVTNQHQTTSEILFWQYELTIWIDNRISRAEHYPVRNITVPSSSPCCYVRTGLTQVHWPESDAVTFVSLQVSWAWRWCHSDIQHLLLIHSQIKHTCFGYNTYLSSSNLPLKPTLSFFDELNCSVNNAISWTRPPITASILEQTLKSMDISAMVHFTVFFTVCFFLKLDRDAI